MSSLWSDMKDAAAERHELLESIERGTRERDALSAEKDNLSVELDRIEAELNRLLMVVNEWIEERTR